MARNARIKLNLILFHLRIGDGKYIVNNVNTLRLNSIRRRDWGVAQYFVSSSIILILLLGVLSCNSLEYEEEVKRYVVSSSIFSCEQDNIHLKVITADDLSLIGSPLLPVCGLDSTCIKEFEYVMRDTALQFEIYGYLSTKPHNFKEYGCHDSKAIKITKFIRLPSFGS